MKFWIIYLEGENYKEKVARTIRLLPHENDEDIPDANEPIELITLPEEYSKGNHFLLVSLRVKKPPVVDELEIPSEIVKKYELEAVLHKAILHSLGLLEIEGLEEDKDLKDILSDMEFQKRTEDVYLTISLHITDGNIIQYWNTDI